MFVIGDDKLGRLAIADIGEDHPIYLNRSADFRRTLRIIQKGAIRPLVVVKMVLADVFRAKVDRPRLPIIASNDDMIAAIARERPARVVCFRAGLVLTKRVLGLEPQFLNIHCAELPKYGGLGALSRALRERAFDQNACLHEMTVEIDGGEVLRRQPYTLSPHRSYRRNEDAAYAAGRQILRDLARENRSS